MTKIILHMMMIVMSTAFLVSAFTGDDRFIRKYAMMKVYESCFGSDVVKEIRKEMKIASAKCMGHYIEPSTEIRPPPSNKNSQKNHLQFTLHKIDAQSEETNHIHSLHNPQETHSHGSHPEALGLHGGPQHQGVPQPAQHDAPPAIHATEAPAKQSSLDLQKLQEAIMSGYNKHLAQNSALQAGFLQQQQQQQTASQQHLRPYYQQQGLAAAPYTTAVTYQQPFYQQPFYQQNQPYYSPVPPPQYYNVPYYQPQVAQPYQQPFFRTNRASRHLGVKGQLETLTAQMAGKVNNVTCVMQELGYLDSNLEPDYMRMLDRISRLPVNEELKRDMAEGVDFCRKFSECVPDDSKDKLVRDLVRPMFFFRCYKHKKLEACIMKDVRERYVMSDAMAEDNLTGNEARSAKGIPSDNMATAIYEFLFGGDTQAILESFY